MNTAQSTTWEITFSDGEVITETCRNTMGGWANMARRIEERFGARMRPMDTTGTRWEIGGRSFTTQEVQS